MLFVFLIFILCGEFFYCVYDVCYEEFVGWLCCEDRFMMWFNNRCMLLRSSMKINV